MLRKRSRTSSTTTKRALMADLSSLPSPTEKFRRPISSLFSSPRLFTGLASKSLSETDFVMSPTSILDSKSGLRNPFWSDLNSPRNFESETKRHCWEKLDSKGIGIGLAIVDAEKSDPKPTKPESRMVLFGSHLKIQIPPLPQPPSVLEESPKSPGDFGIKTRNSQLGFSSSCLSRSPARKSSSGLPESPRVFAGALSATEMELSEDYTCVITHGPNPRTTHIFDNCIVESCCGVVGFSSSRKDYGFPSDRSSLSSENFLSFCYSCKKSLSQGKDIYMYRGEKAFCSSECRNQEMMLDEGIDKQESDGF
ncbi:hypothetical protein UlMin_009255 [Ulmus minor]